MNRFKRTNDLKSKTTLTLDFWKAMRQLERGKQSPVAFARETAEATEYLEKDLAFWTDEIKQFVELVVADMDAKNAELEHQPRFPSQLAVDAMIQQVAQQRRRMLRISVAA